MALDTRNIAGQIRAFAPWEEAFASGDTQTLLRLNAYHLARFPKLASAFGDLARELRFSDLGDDARAVFVLEVLTALSDNGQLAAREQCLRAGTQLENQHAQRARRSSHGDRRHD